LPFLEPFLKAEDLELKNQVRATIERIYETDPLYLVRRPKRMVSVTLKDVPRSRAVEELFRPFNVRPPLRSKSIISEEPPGLVTLKLEGATFWQACRALAKATKTEISFESFDQLELKPAAKSQRASIFTQDNCLIDGRAMRIENGVRLGIHGYLEPGWLIPTATLTIDLVEGSDGRSYQTAFRLPDKESSSGERNGWSSFTPECRFARKEDLPAGITLSVRGSLTLELPTKVEAIQCRPPDLKLPATYTASGCNILLKELKISEEGYSYSLTQHGPRNWKAPVGKPFHDGFLIVFANDRGPLVHVGSCGYGGEANMSVSSGWSSHLEFWQPPTRFCLLRILEIERVTMPYELRDIEIAESEQK
jgi:hypothetical protein